MLNITSQARSLLARQQQQQQQNPTNLSGTMTTIRPGLPSGLNELIINVYTNIPQELERFLELCQDFIHMGSHHMASAYVLKVIHLMEEAKGAVVQNMSVAGSQINYDSRSNVVEPWLTRNGTFLNRTSAPSRVGSSLSAFKRPLPPTNRKHLRPIQENLPPPCHVNVKNRIVRSTPIRPKYRDNEIFAENLSPLQAEKKGPCRKLPPPTSRAPAPTSPGRSEPADEDEEEEDLLTRNSPSTRSNSKKRNESPEVARKNPKKKRPVPRAPDTDTLNSTVTRLGRVVKPPRKFTTGQDNSIIEDIRDAKQHPKVAAPRTQRQPERPAENERRVAVNEEKVTKKRTHPELSSPVREDRAPVQKIKKKVPREDNRAAVRQDREILGDVSEATKTIKKSESKENNKRPQTAKADTTVTKKRKLLPTVEDMDRSLKKLWVAKKPGSAIKFSVGGSPQIDFDISQRSFLSCDESSEDEM